MDRQAPEMMTATEAPAATLHSIGDFLTHAATMIELQWKLLALDAQEAARDSRAVLVGAAAAGGLMFGALLVALYGVAELIVEMADWPRSGALLITAVGTAVAGAALGYWLRTELLRRRAIFFRSQNELRRNLATVRRVIDEYATQPTHH